MTTATTLKAALANCAYQLEKQNKCKAELDETLMMIPYAWYGGNVKELAEIAKHQTNLINAHSKFTEKLKFEVERLYQKLSAENKNRRVA